MSWDIYEVRFTRVQTTHKNWLVAARDEKHAEELVHDGEGMLVLDKTYCDPSVKVVMVGPLRNMEDVDDV